MKKIFGFVFLLIVFATPSLQAQFLDLSIPSGELPSDLASWPTVAGLMHISFVIPDGIHLENAHIVFELTEGSEHILASTRTRFAEQPPITGTFRKKNFSFNDIVTAEAIETDLSIRTASSAIGKLPGGFFGICFYLVDSVGQPVKNIFQACTNFFVRDIDAPVLLSPQNGTTISPSTPLSFSWTPARVISQTVHYMIKLYPVFPGQSAEQAMSSSSAIYTSDEVFSTTFPYPPEAPRLTSIANAKGFTWTVSQVDQNGKSIGKNYGRSIPYVFYLLK